MAENEQSKLDKLEDVVERAASLIDEVVSHLVQSGADPSHKAKLEQVKSELSGVVGHPVGSVQADAPGPSLPDPTVAPGVGQAGQEQPGTQVPISAPVPEGAHRPGGEHVSSTAHPEPPGQTQEAEAKAAKSK